MKNVEIKKTVLELLDNLCDRSGFDDWYFNLGEDIQTEIERELFETINRRVNKDNDSLDSFSKNKPLPPPPPKDREIHISGKSRRKQ